MKKPASSRRRAVGSASSQPPERSGQRGGTEKGVSQRASPPRGKDLEDRTPLASRGPEAAPERPGAPGRERQVRATEPAPQLADLLARTKEKLLELAGELKLKGLSKLAKSDIARRVLAAREARHAAAAPETPAAAAPETPAAAAPEAAAPEAPPAVPAREAPPQATAAASPPAGAVPLERPSPAAAARLDLGPGAGGTGREEHIPWSYGQDRITAMAVDPDTLYVYWEVADRPWSGREPRSGTRAAAPGSVCGSTTSAGSSSTAPTRTRTSTTVWGAPIASGSSPSGSPLRLRSSRSGCGRRAATSSSRAVVAGGLPAELAGALERSRVDDGAGQRGRRARRPRKPCAAWAARRRPGSRRGGAPSASSTSRCGCSSSRGQGEQRFRELFGEAFERIEWQETHAEGWYELQGRLEWQVGPMVSSWEAGPFTYPVQVDPPSRRHVGRRRGRLHGERGHARGLRAVAGRDPEPGRQARSERCLGAGRSSARGRRAVAWSRCGGCRRRGGSARRRLGAAGRERLALAVRQRDAAGRRERAVAPRGERGPPARRKRGVRGRERAPAGRGQRAAAGGRERVAPGRRQRAAAPGRERAAAGRGQRAEAGRRQRAAAGRGQRAAAGWGQRAAAPAGASRTGRAGEGQIGGEPWPRRG